MAKDKSLWLLFFAGKNQTLHNLSRYDLDKMNLCTEFFGRFVSQTDQT